MRANETSRENKKILVLGLGNIFCGDDGIGSIIAENLGKDIDEQKIDIIDGGTIGLGLMYLFEDYTDLIIIDAVDMKASPGEVLVFSLDDLSMFDNEQKISFHQSGLYELLRFAKALGKLPPRIMIFGIQIGETSFENGLSEQLQSELVKIEEKIKEEIYRYLKNA